MKQEETGQQAEWSQIDRDYRRDVFLTEAQPRAKRLFFGAWVVLDMLLVFGVLGYLAYYFTLGSAFDKRFTARAGANIEAQHAISEARSAQGLDIRRTDVFAVSGNFYDLRAEVENVNEDWYALVSYQFTSSAGDSEVLREMILPNETRALIALRQEFTSRPSNADLVLLDVAWMRVPAGEIPDYESWILERRAFRVLDGNYSNDITIEGKAIPRATFRLVNDSAYSYWNAPFLVEIMRGGIVAAVTRIQVPAFLAGETRDIVVNWFGSAPATGSLRVTPLIPFFDESVYMPPSGIPESDIRDAIELRP